MSSQRKEKQPNTYLWNKSYVLLRVMKILFMTWKTELLVCDIFKNKKSVLNNPRDYAAVRHKGKVYSQAFSPRPAANKNLEDQAVR